MEERKMRQKLKKMYVMTIVLAVLVTMVTIPSFLWAGEKGATIGETEVAVVTIVKIDKKTREITVRNEDGKKATFVAGQEVRNFDQLKRGDLILTELYGALALAIAPKGSGLKERVDQIIIKRAKKGKKPGVTIKQITTASGVVKSVDPKKRLVTVEGVQNTLTLKVADDVDISKIKVGDPVEAAFIMYYVIKVEPAPKVSGTIEFKTRAVAIGVGYEWGKGTLKMYDGSVHTFKVKGVSVVDIGISEVKATGKVYHLVEPKDMEGKYLAGAAGITIYKGGSAVAMQNGNGVVIHLKSKQKGIKFTLAPQGLYISDMK
jgi:Cu/Ag efflux protein CusF